MVVSKDLLWLYYAILAKTPFKMAISEHIPIAGNNPDSVYALICPIRNKWLSHNTGPFAMWQLGRNSPARSWPESSWRDWWRPWTSNWDQSKQGFKNHKPHRHRPHHHWAAHWITVNQKLGWEKAVVSNKYLDGYLLEHEKNNDSQ